LTKKRKNVSNNKKSLWKILEVGIIRMVRKREEEEEKAEGTEGEGKDEEVPSMVFCLHSYD
jgi:hypothetical protein